jgi:hypothetical protein
MFHIQKMIIQVAIVIQVFETVLPKKDFQSLLPDDPPAKELRIEMNPFQGSVAISGASNSSVASLR